MLGVHAVRLVEPHSTMAGGSELAGDVQHPLPNRPRCPSSKPGYQRASRRVASTPPGLHAEADPRVPSDRRAGRRRPRPGCEGRHDVHDRQGAGRRREVMPRPTPAMAP